MMMVNLENDRVLACRVREASSFLRRFAGLMFTRSLPVGEALHIRPCRAVHTFFMRYAIDVVHLDGSRRIVGIEREMHPGRLGGTFEGGESVVELPAGTIAGTGTQVGHAVVFKKG